jgi:hypothetical protein
MKILCWCYLHFQWQSPLFCPRVNARDGIFHFVPMQVCHKFFNNQMVPILNWLFKYTSLPFVKKVCTTTAHIYIHVAIGFIPVFRHMIFIYEVGFCIARNRFYFYSGYKAASIISSATSLPWHCTGPISYTIGTHQVFWMPSSYP